MLITNGTQNRSPVDAISYALLHLDLVEGLSFLDFLFAGAAKVA
jgi:hypothetical protein